MGTTAGRIITYNLKDVKQSKWQVQGPQMTTTGITLNVSALLFKRPIKSAASTTSQATSKVTASEKSAGDKSSVKMKPPQEVVSKKPSE